jgi:arginine N-succinyltransferase
MAGFEICAATRADEEALFGLARFLNTVNLPNDRAAIARILDLSERSFSGQIQDPREREYVFLLYDREHQRAIGSSMIVAQLGRPGEPYIYLDVDREERYSDTLRRHFIHQVLTVRYSYAGPTELGGLVVHPAYRASVERFGTLISFVRFLFIAMHRALFQEQLLAELLPPLEPDGTSHLWEALGRHFTGLSYSEADHLSKRNKEFIRGLFPRGEIYATLLPPKAQAVIGAVGEQTRGVEKLLRRIGFRYAERVDPFDGGPHFIADVDQVSLVRRARCVRLEVAASANGPAAEQVLLARRSDAPPFFVAIPALVQVREDCAAVDPSLLARLDALGEGPTWLLPVAK